MFTFTNKTNKATKPLSIKANDEKKIKQFSEKNTMGGEANKKAHSAKLKSTIRCVSILIAVLVISLVGFFFYKWFVVAKVNNHVITRWELWNKMESSYGNQAVQDLANDLIIQDALNASGVSVNQNKIDEAYQKLDTQLKSPNSAQSLSLKKGITKEELRKQILTELKIQQLLKDDIKPTEDEINAEYLVNKDKGYKGKTLSEVRDSIIESITERKLNEEFTKWIAGIKKDATVKITL